MGKPSDSSRKESGSLGADDFIIDSKSLIAQDKLPADIKGRPLADATVAARIVKAVQLATHGFAIIASRESSSVKSECGGCVQEVIAIGYVDPALVLEQIVVHMPEVGRALFAGAKGRHGRILAVRAQVKHGPVDQPHSPLGYVLIDNVLLRALHEGVTVGSEEVGVVDERDRRIRMAQIVGAIIAASGWSR